jgi:aspartate aminotransferase
MRIAHSATLEINERVAEHRRAGRAVLHLGFGEAGLPVLPELVDQLRAAAPDSSYAPVAGSEPARVAAAGYWERRGLPTSPDQLLLAPGSKPLLYAALAALDGDVVLPEPSWVTYAAQAALTGKQVIGVPVPPDYGGVPDPDRLEEAVRTARSHGADPRVLLLTLPDNPTGTLAPDDAVRRLCALADRLGLVVVSDEIYRDLTHDGSRFASPAAYLTERTIVTCGLSKSLALGGWRIGFVRVPATAEGQRWRSAMLGVASEVWSSIATPMETAAVYALDEPEPVRRHVEASRRLHGAVASAVYSCFADAGASVRRPSAGFYLYPDLENVRGMTSGASLARFLLDEHGVAVLPGVAFGDRPEALRFRAATSLLYGDDEQRWTALQSTDPCSLPWITSSLDQLRTVLASLG